jgi:hypothetical protein
VDARDFERHILGAVKILVAMPGTTENKLLRLDYDGVIRNGLKILNEPYSEAQQQDATPHILYQAAVPNNSSSEDSSGVVNNFASGPTTENYGAIQSVQCMKKISTI